MNDLSDAELIRLTRRNPRATEYREELFDRADGDVEYRGDRQLLADLDYHGIRRPAATIPTVGTAVADRYRKRFA